MNYATEPIAKALREARQRKGLSQRALSAMVGVPQAHISKIEAGAVDLRLSSLIGLARALDLELTLVPRNTMPAVKSIVRTIAPSTSLDGGGGRRVHNELQRLQNTVNRLSKTLPNTPLSQDQLESIRQTAHQLQNFSRISQSELQTIRNAHHKLSVFLANPENQHAIGHVATQLQQLRNHLVHQRTAEALPARPAYSLDGDDDA